MSDSETRIEQLQSLATRAVAVEACNARVREDETREQALVSISVAAQKLDAVLMPEQWGSTVEAHRS